MSIRTILVLILAIVFGASAALALTKFRNSGSTPAEETVPVVVSADQIERFAVLTPDQLSVRQYPKKMVPAGSFRTIEEVLTRRTKLYLGKGEPILDYKLAPTGPGGIWGLVIPQGLRAVTIKTDIAASVAGGIHPGDRVDVILNIRGQGTEIDGGASSQTLLQNVEIFAVDQLADPATQQNAANPNLRSVTLLVTPNEMNKLDLARNQGTLHLALRNAMDKESVNAKKWSIRDILQGRNSKWDERLRALLSEGSKFLSKLKEMPQKGGEEPSEKIQPAAATVEPEPVKKARIRVLRGTISSDVRFIR